MHEQHVQHYKAVGVPFAVVRRFLTDQSLPALDAPRRIGVDSDARGRHPPRPRCCRTSPHQRCLFSRHRVCGRTESVAHGSHSTLVGTRRSPGHLSNRHRRSQIEPIDDRRTMVSLLASYQPPLGRIGAVVDRVAMHRLAESALRRFFEGLLLEIKTNARASSA